MSVLANRRAPSKSRPRPPLHHSYQPPVLKDGPGILTLWHGKGDASDYYVYRIGSDFGQAARLEKFHSQGDDVYHVNLGADHTEHLCDCLGFLRWGTLCKHIQALEALA